MSSTAPPSVSSSTRPSASPATRNAPPSVVIGSIAVTPPTGSRGKPTPGSLARAAGGAEEEWGAAGGQPRLRQRHARVGGHGAGVAEEAGAPAVRADARQQRHLAVAVGGQQVGAVGAAGVAHGHRDGAA